MINPRKAADNEVKYTLQVDTQREIVFLTFYRNVGLKELVDSFSEMVRLPEFKKNMSSCYDFTQAIVEVDLNKTEIFYHFAAGMREKRGDSYYLAFVYGDEMTKMLGEFYRLFLARADVQVRLFKQKALAEQWISEHLLY